MSDAAPTTYAEALARANLHIGNGDLTRVSVYGEATSEEVVTLEFGAPTSQVSAPLVRVHSACFTGDVLGSLGCDCGGQLRFALDAVSREAYGIVVYLLRHEGRGIGLANKVRAYRLQEQGLDTIAANLALGFPADARGYGAAVAALRSLGVTRVRLLTNNPAKMAALEAGGITVVERIPVPVQVTEYNHNYLAVKRRSMGHLIPE